ncbi:hypothetical protein [Nostoc sp. JL33]|nr:hypothetical protein [Nostoc sp. JL33]
MLTVGRCRPLKAIASLSSKKIKEAIAPLPLRIRHKYPQLKNVYI